MARHGSPHTPTVQRVLVALATAGVALGAGAATASADTDPVADVLYAQPVSFGDVDPQTGIETLTGAVGYATGPVWALRPNPLAGTGVDPLDNGVATQFADFQPLYSQSLTDPFAEAQSFSSMPVAGEVAELLNG
ncbi:hypothetical protein F7R91_36510 [Streptomyces luteolifulvus]|uniref:Uncharacterized protein n=1 Tax=Streptomyces luteolifulvus TaxID=2615112 RepID=A0A6H9URE7_9ACTN|nr:hypothetical protein [Streptomyces luteolifulvus]KAB1140283.1 hypothetical protein F7R91_36510 [Streptomyces luteolifulvus]